MSTTTHHPPLIGATPGGRATAPAGVVAKRTPAVKVWATVGGLFLAFETYLITAWVLSKDFAVVPSGPSKMSGFESAMTVFWQVGGVLALAGFLWWFVARPYRRTRTLPLDGLLVLCFALIEWQDPLCNYVKDWGSYNTNLVQWGSWVEQIPGWMSPNGSRFAEPLLVMVPIYVWAVFGFTILGCWALRKVKARFPTMGTVGIIVTAYAMFIVVDFVLETIWMRTGIWAYPGGGPGHVFFAGTRYQFPIHESLLWGGAWASFTLLRYFRNDRGETLVERGIEDVRGGEKKKLALRFLALFGAVNVLYLGLYNIPMSAVVMHNTSWSPGVEKVTYMNDYLCGSGTSFACATKNTPIPWKTSAHVAPDGRLIKPGKEPARPVGIR